MTNKARISKGGFTVARQIFFSPIWFKDPLFIKLWLWIIGQANHENIKKNGFQYKRGEIVTTYNEIMKALSYRHNRKYIKPTLKKVRIMLEWLVNEGMIKVEPLQENAPKTANPELTERCRTGADTTALTRAYIGIKIIVVNYNTYQSLENYRGRHKGRDLSEQGHYNNNDNNKNYSAKIKNFVEEFISYSIQEHGKTAPKNTLSLFNNSCDVLDKLIGLDGFEDGYIYDVINWTKTDAFWSQQVKSLAPLRKKAKNGLTKFQNIASSFDKMQPQNNTLSESERIYTDDPVRDPGSEK